MQQGLPVIDLEGLPGDTAARERIATALDAAFRGRGFCLITNHGVDADIRRKAFEASHAFHALPDDAKRAIAMNDAHRGYMTPRSSKIVTSSVATVTRPNHSESFMMMHPVATDSPAWGRPLQGPNQWPAQLPSFRPAVEAYYGALDRLAREFSRLLARALGLPEGWFDPYFVEPTVYLRLLHYPPLGPDAPDDQFGSAPHTDYGFITLLAQDDIGGLQVRGPDGAWIDVPVIENSFVVNVADLLSHWTGGRWRSTPHRVLNNRAGRDRYSIAFFFDPTMDAMIEPLPGLGDDGGQAIHHGDYVMERLNKNYAYRQGRTG